MRILNSVRYAFGICAAVALLTGCSGANQSSTVTPPTANGGSRSHHVKRNAGSCVSIQDSTGATYTAAQTGGGNDIDVEYSTQSCDVGIYINGSNGPNTLDHAMVNGPFEIGIYFDGAGNTAREDHTQICVNGSNGDGTCATGTSTSPGTGLDVRNTPKFSADHTSIDGYVAGFATNPCPNQNNDMTVDHTAITNATDPWSYEGGNNNFNFQAGHDSPSFNGQSCAGSGVGTGAAPQVPALFVASGGDATVSAFTINETTGALTPVAGSPYSTGSNADLTVDSTGNYLYVAGNGVVYAFAINPTTAALTPVTGSPFAASGNLNAVAVDSGSNFLYASDIADSLIDGYTINETNGALTPIAGSPFAVGQSPQGLSVDPLGPYLCVSAYGSANSIQMYAINSVTGALTSAAGPYTLNGSGYAAVVYPGGRYLYAPSQSNAVYGFAAASNGALTAISGSPWGTGSSPRVSAITPEGTFLYVPNEQSQNIYGYQVNPSSGALTSVSGSPFGAGSNPEGVSIDPTGSFLYAAISNNQDVWAYSIDQSSGALTPISGSPYSISGNGNYLTIRGSSVGGQWRRHHHVGKHGLQHLGSQLMARTLR